MQDIILNIAIIILAFSYGVIARRGYQERKRVARLAKEISKKFQEDTIDGILSRDADKLMRG
jgi:hypothetical protein